MNEAIERQKNIFISLSAVFVIRMFKDKLNDLFSKSRFVFANKIEAINFADVNEITFTGDMELLALECL